MDRYIDIRILPDPEFASNQLMNALFAKLHRCLVRLGAADIGVSFPGLDPKQRQLGPLLRLHGAEDAFARLLGEEWLTGMRDHVRISGVQAVPDHVGHQRVRRVQVKSNPERVRRRQIRRHQWTEEEAKRRIPDSVGRTLSMPFLTLESGSTGHRFRLFIDQTETDCPIPGLFNAYGLSGSATVPRF